MNEVFLLLLAFQAKHFIADYILQTERMLLKFSRFVTDWVPALGAHCLVHMVFTFIISIIYTNNIDLSFVVSIMDYIIHFIMDRIKASPFLLGKFKPLSGMEYRFYKDESESDNETISEYSKEKLKHNKYFWWALGLDQTVHHLTHYGIIFIIYYRG